MNILRVKRKCIELLERVDCDGAYLHLVLQEAAHGTVGDPEEYPLVVQFVRGVSEQKRVLEEVLNRYLPKGLASLPQFVQYVLTFQDYWKIGIVIFRMRRDLLKSNLEFTKIVHISQRQFSSRR